MRRRTDNQRPGPVRAESPAHRRGDQELSFFSITASVSAATDVTVEEPAIEAFYPD